MYPQATLKLASSASDQNTYLTYVCLISEVKPDEHVPLDTRHKLSPDLLDTGTSQVDDDDHIRVERSKALHELVECHRKSEDTLDLDLNETYLTTPYQTTSGEESDKSERDTEDASLYTGNPNILKLTKMKWLTENQDGGPDSSSPSLSPKSSTTSDHSQESEYNLAQHMSLSDKYLSTILRLDKEHNMFGLSNIAIVGSRASKRIRKEDDKPVFHQTAIVQICCAKGCCKHKSNTDLPASLKCGGCRGCCVDPFCPVCVAPGPPCCLPPPPVCPKGKCNCKTCCPTSKCLVDCSKCYGMKILLNRKPKYDPSPLELTPRASCILQKPLAARSCHHLPHCIPPSSCFPYLMPCFWPARPAAPCNTPARCFHNPPCLGPRRRSAPQPPEETCAPASGGKCEDDSKKTKCGNQTCPGNNPNMKKELESRFGKNKAGSAGKKK